MDERVIDLHPQWLKEEEALMLWISIIVSGNVGYKPTKKDSGYAWQLDPANNTFAEIRNGRLVLAHRYLKNKVDTLAEFLKAWM
jgi:hypothetical protein